VEGVERTNAVVVRGLGQGIGAPRRDLYAIEVNWGRYCYVCRRFEHMACHCRNRERGRTWKEE